MSADQTVARTSDHASFNDPLFRFYFCRFLDLYQLLAASKPKLIQESVAYGPWKLLLVVTLLNKTAGRAAVLVFWMILEKWPTPWATSKADPGELKGHIHHLGTFSIRSQRLIKISGAYIYDPLCEHDVRSSLSASPTKRSSSDTPRRSRRYPPTPISHLPGTYALDSYRIFCSNHNDPSREERKTVLPTDKELILYLVGTLHLDPFISFIIDAIKRWKWAYQQRKEWSPLTSHFSNCSSLNLRSTISVRTMNACQNDK